MKNHLRTILLGFACLFSYQLTAQEFEWVKTGGSEGFETANSVAVDSDGNVYTVGGFGGTVDFNEGGEAAELTATGSPDLFILKQDAMGGLIWVKPLNSSLWVNVAELKLDSEGNVLLAGHFYDTVDFNPGIEEELRVASGGTDCFILKLNNDGDFEWVKTYGSGGATTVRGMTIDNEGNILNVGSFTDTADFDPGPGELLEMANGYGEIYVQKLDSDGNLLWLNHYVSTEDNYDSGSDIIVTADNEIIVVGVFYGVMDFDLSDEVTYAFASSLGAGFALKLTEDGAFTWVSSISEEMSQISMASVTVSPEGDVYTLGRFSGIVDLDGGDGELIVGSEGEHDIFIQKLNADGDFQWGKTFGSPFGDFPASITYDEADHILFYFSFSYVIDMDPAEDSEFELTSEGFFDLGLGILDPDGDFVSALSFGGDMDEFPYSMVTDVEQNIYLTGSFLETTNFDPSGSELRTSHGSEDFFILKLSEALSIEKTSEPLKMAIYPNPVNDIVHIRSHPGSQIELIDFSGRVCKTITSDQNIESINVSKYRPGVYFVRILAGGEYTTKKLIIR